MPVLITVVGPTAIGKTDLAIQLARHFDTEILSADSRQFFKEMSIGTAKPSPTELQAAQHHFINSHSITEAFSVGDFEREALETLSEIFKKRSCAILVGGSGLYVKAITEGFDDLPVAPKAVRDELNERLEKEGIGALQQQLKKLDPDYSAEVDIRNPQRIIRALEVCISSGKPFSQFRSGKRSNRPFEVLKIGLNTSREVLYQRINDRVDQMMTQGLLDEVRSLLPYRDLNALQTVGYQELFDYLDGVCSLEQAIDKIKQNTRRFAKRQLTWFRKDADIHWYEPQETEKILAFLNQKLG